MNRPMMAIRRENDKNLLLKTLYQLKEHNTVLSLTLRMILIYVMYIILTRIYYDLCNLITCFILF